MSNSRHHRVRLPRISPASTIVNQVSGGEYVRDYVNESLSVIEEDIWHEIDSVNKKNYAVSEIPTTFDIPGMSNKRAQLHVYYHLLHTLEDAGYQPKIRILGNHASQQKVFIYVRWLSPRDIDAEKKMNDYIHSRQHHTDSKIPKK